MTVAPYVELGFNPTELRPQDLPRAGAFLGSPAEALEAAFAVTRTAMVTQMKAEVRGLQEPTHAQLLRIADLAWQAAFWRYRKVSAPIVADAYWHAYQAADAGDVPMNVIYDLADKHAEKIGEYFHLSSREALSEGFSSMVNRRVPAKEAAGRVLDAYGLTPRQMRAYTSASQFETPISDVLPRPLKARARAFIDKAFTSRIKKMSEQEEHNIDEQAKQLAWMWLQDKGRLGEKAQKMWLTAKDERVCPVCGPLHGKRVGVNEKFVTSQGEFWTPGLHPNCRCELRLLEHRFTKNAFGIVEKIDWDPKEHPRGGDPENRGRFSRRPAARTLAYKEPETRPVIETAPETKEEAPAKLTSLGGELTSLAGGGEVKSLGPSVSSLRGEVSELGGPKVSALGEQPVGALGQRVTSLSDEQVEELITLGITPEMRLQMDRTVASLVEADVKRKPKAKSTFWLQTLRIKDPQGNPYPVYAVVDATAGIDYATNQVELTHDLEFSHRLTILSRQYKKKFNEQVKEVYRATETELARFPIQQKTSGRTWTLDLTDEELMNIVEYKAHRGQIPKGYSDMAAQWKRDEYITVDWVDEGGNRHPQTHLKMELAKDLHLHDSDFTVRILRLDEGHDSKHGTTVQKEAGTKAGMESWVTSGLYHVEPATEEVGGKHYTELIEVYHLTPDALEYEIKPFFGGE